MLATMKPTFSAMQCSQTVNAMLLKVPSSLEALKIFLIACPRRKSASMDIASLQRHCQLCLQAVSELMLKEDGVLCLM